MPTIVTVSSSSLPTVVPMATAPHAPCFVLLSVVFLASVGIGSLIYSLNVCPKWKPTY